MSKAVCRTDDGALHGNAIVRGFCDLCGYVCSNISTFSMSRFNPVMNLFTRHVIISGFTERITAKRDSFQLETLSFRCGVKMLPVTNGSLRVQIILQQLKTERVGIF